MMSAICIRFLCDGMFGDKLKKLHHQVASMIEKEGRFWLATTEMKGKTWFRINPVNIQTTEKHMEMLYADLKAKCLAMASEVKLADAGLL